MDRLLRMQDKVEYCLTKYPITRDDDRLLIGAVYALFYDVDMSAPFKQVLKNKDLPNFESIRRCRQKAQAENEALRGKKDKERLDRQAEYVKYAKTDSKGDRI